MSHPGDAWLARLAIRLGRVTQEQVEACLAEQEAWAQAGGSAGGAGVADATGAGAHRAAAPPPLGALLVRRGWLTEAALHELLAAQPDAGAASEAAADGDGAAAVAPTVRHESQAAMAATLRRDASAETAATLHRDSPTETAAALKRDSPGETAATLKCEAVPSGTPPPGPAEPAGEPFGRYRILKELGRGGMGVVYQAWDCELRRIVALKTLLSEAASTPDDVARFLREARAAARLSHPNIVQVHDVGTHGERHYFTMEFVAGESLESARGRLPARRFLEVLRDVALALHAAHEAGVVHRDVKPANILLDGSGRPFVSDFGLAKEVREKAAGGATRSGAVMGTPHFMAPEQAAGRVGSIGPATDLWALGVILYQQLSGRVPFDGESFVQIGRAILESDPVPPSVAARSSSAGGRRQVHRDLETICLKCLEKDPARRYASAAELAADLGRFLDGDPIVARPISTAERLARKAVRYRWIVGPVAAALLFLGAALLMSRVAGTRGTHLQAEGVLLRAEGGWREAKSLLYRPEVPLERYHEKLAAAVALYDEALAQAPEYGWIYESRGRVWLETDDLVKAEQDLKRASELLGPDLGRAARRSLGRVYLERSFEFHYSFSQEDRARKAEEMGVWRARALVELEASAGRIEWRGTTDEGENVERLARGFTAWGRGEQAEAARIFRQGVQEASDEECAWALSLLPPEGEQAEWRDRSLRLRPRFARALLARGGAREAKGDLDGALADFAQALQINPRYLEAYINRGNLRRDRGDLDGAQADFAEALRINPRFALAYANRGKVHQARGDAAGAVADFEKALEVAPAAWPHRKTVEEWLRALRAKVPAPPVK